MKALTKTSLLFAVAVSACLSVSATALAAEVIEFTTLHGEYLTEINERRDAFNDKMDQIRSELNQVPAEFNLYKIQMLSRLDSLSARVSIGSYSITTPQQTVIKVPNEDVLDNYIDQLEGLADALEDNADDADNDFAEDVAEEIKDLVDDLDRLEDRLTNKTNRLKSEWVELGGEYEYF